MRKVGRKESDSEESFVSDTFLAANYEDHSSQFK